MPKMYEKYTVQRGLFKELAREKGVSSFDIRSEFMKSVAEATRKYLDENKLDYAYYWTPVTMEILKIAYRLMAKLRRVPTPEEILEAYLKEKEKNRQAQTEEA